MINRCVPFNELDKAVNEMATYYSSAPTKAIGAIKLAFNQSYDSNLNEMLELEAKNQEILSKSKDAAEGISSFLQKRTPDYKGI